MKDLLNALRQIEPPGKFCAATHIPANALDIEIDTIGTLQWPLSQAQIELMLAQATPASFGKREKTLLDKRFRHTWQLESDRVKINPESWNNCLNQVLDQLKQDLGLSQKKTLTAELHSLLIYEQGQFFKPHQDSEKKDGMVASLVIMLPAYHRGGTLVINHHGEKKMFQSSRRSLQQATCVAFYADCYHEVKPVTEGHRVSLTFNLMLTDNDSTSEEKDEKDISVNSITPALDCYFTSKQEEEATADKKAARLAYLLDHDYTARGLLWKNLKNIDALRADALKKAAEALDLEISLSLADISECWQCEFDDSSYRRRGWRGNDAQPKVTDPIELIYEEVRLDHWRDPHDQPLPYSEFSFPFEDICWTKATHDFTPFDTEYEGYMGNYGNTMERWYHRAAIVLWRKEDHHRILLEMDPIALIHDLSLMAQNDQSTPKVADIVAGLITDWQGPQPRNYKDYTTSVIEKLCQIALAIQNPEHATALLSPFSLSILSVPVADQLVLLAQNYGVPWALDLIKLWGENSRHGRSTSSCKDLPPVAKILASQLPETSLADELLTRKLELIKEADQDIKDDSRSRQIKGCPARLETTAEFMQACLATENQNANAMMIDHIIANPDLYPITKLEGLIDYLRVIKKSSLNWGYDTLFKYVYQYLEKEYHQGARASDDWSIDVTPDCHCEDCEKLTSFLRTRDQIEKAWPLRKDDRQHIHRVISELSIPVSHETQRTGRPFSLILKKKPKLHQDAKKHFALITKFYTKLSHDRPEP